MSSMDDWNKEAGALWILRSMSSVPYDKIPDCSGHEWVNLDTHVVNQLMFSRRVCVRCWRQETRECIHRDRLAAERAEARRRAERG